MQATTTNFNSYGQLLWEENFLSMPFLLEELPFLEQFDGPEVTLQEILHILANPPSTSISPAVNTTVGPQQTESFYPPHSDMIFPAQNHMVHKNLATQYNTVNNPFAHQINNNFAHEDNTNFPTTHSTQITQAAAHITKHKKSCNMCTQRKAKCVIVAGSDPKLCVACQKKGLQCVFELRKEYGSSKA